MENALPANYLAASSVLKAQPERIWRTSRPRIPPQEFAALAAAESSSRGLWTAAVRARAVLGDPDTYWHIAIGRWIIAHREVPRFDVFSFSMPGAPFTPPEWLAELGIAWLYDRFGWGALVAATALSVAAALTMLLRALLRSLMPAQALIATVLATLLTLRISWRVPTC